MELKATHASELGVSNSSFRGRSAETETCRVGHIDSIVLQVRYASNRRGRLQRISDSHDNCETMELNGWTLHDFGV